MNHRRVSSSIENINACNDNSNGIPTTLPLHHSKHNKSKIISSSYRTNHQRNRSNSKRSRHLYHKIICCSSFMILLSVHLYLCYSISHNNEQEHNNILPTTTTTQKIHDDNKAKVESELFEPPIYLTLEEARERNKISPLLPLEYYNTTQDTIDISNILNSSSHHVFEKPPLLSILQPIDLEYYTVRINTYHRNEQLLESLNHHSKCEGVIQIQVIWCDSDNDPPPEIKNHSSGKVMIEYHEINSLNERFNILSPQMLKTKGILSIDDDVLRPCDAIDAGFFKWTKFPQYMVGFDTRLHNSKGKENEWSYGPLSVSQQQNLYSISLTRYAFLHADYMNLYYHGYIPTTAIHSISSSSTPTQHNNDNYKNKILSSTIFNLISKEFNCEDIAMSYLISSLTEGETPLLADYWATKTQFKLYTPTMISKTDSHKGIRDVCVDTFAEELGLKETKKKIINEIDGESEYDLQQQVKVYPLKTAERHFQNKRTLTHFGREITPKENNYLELIATREQALRKKINSWKTKGSYERYFDKVMNDLAKEPREKGLMKNTKEWKKKWKKGK